MKKKFYYLVILAAVIFLSSCSKEVAIKPTPLTGFQPTVTVHKQWSNGLSTNKNSYLKLAPAIINNKIFIASSNGKIKAIDINNGKTLWQISTNAPISSGVTVNNNLLFVGTVDGRVLALQQQNGTVQWQGKVVGNILAAPTANDDTVVVKTEVGSLRAFQANDGQVLWSFDQNNPSLILHGSSSPKIVNNSVICGFANGEMISLSLSNGTIKWKQQIAMPNGSFLVQRMVDIVADPVISDNFVYVVTYQGNIAAININNGNIVWQQPMSSTAGLTVDKENVYVIGNEDKIFALNKYNGNTIWHQDAFTYRGLTAPAILNNLLIVADAEGYVHWLNTTNGQIAARAKISGAINVTPTTYNNAVYVYSVTGNLVKLSR